MINCNLEKHYEQGAFSPPECYKSQMAGGRFLMTRGRNRVLGVFVSGTAQSWHRDDRVMGTK